MFSTREVQVLAGVTRGKSNKEIAKDLGLSDLTIKSHVARVMRRAGKSPNRAALVSWGYRKGYLRGLSKEKTAKDVPVMTDREREVLQNAVKGFDNAYIGRRLFLTEDTIKTYMARLLRKWGARNRAHLTALAWQAGVARESWWETPAAPEMGVPEDMATVPVVIPESAPVPVVVPSVAISVPPMATGEVCPTCGSTVARILDMSADTESGADEEESEGV